MSLLVSDIIKMAQKQLKEAGIESYESEAKQIYCHLKKIDRMQFFQRWATIAEEGEIKVYFDLIKRRSEREPMQHIMGEVEFMGYPFIVKKGVLIPRMDTEAVVLQAEKYVENKSKVLDLCCGSGIIGISLYKRLAEKGKSIKLTSVDISDEAISLTEENCKLNNVKIEILKSDLFENKKIKKYDMIVSNPPYIPRQEIDNLDVEVKTHDPILALDGGLDGLDFYKKITENAKEHLKKKGILLFEIGYNQGNDVGSILKANGFDNIEITKDLSGRDRAIKGEIVK